MKIHLLYEDPYDEGANVFGAFSTEEKAETARDIFSKVNTHQLYIQEIELDELQNYFSIAQSGYVWFSGFKQRHQIGESIFYGKWDIYQHGLDSLLELDQKETVVERKDQVWSKVKARTPEEAEKISDEILEKRDDRYIAWLE